MRSGKVSPSPSIATVSTAAGVVLTTSTALPLKTTTIQEETVLASSSSSASIFTISTATGVGLTSATTNLPLKTTIIQKAKTSEPPSDTLLPEESTKVESQNLVINESNLPIEIDPRERLELLNAIIPDASASTETEIISNEVSDTELPSKEIASIEIQGSIINKSDPTIENDTLEISNEMITDVPISNSIMIDASASKETKAANNEVVSSKNDDDDLDDFYAALMKDS
jgi:hypothetical protein